MEIGSLAVGDRPFERFNDRIIVREIIINNASKLTIRRDGQEQILPIDKKFVQLLSSRDAQNEQLFAPRFPFYVEEFGKNAPAKDAGLELGDRIISLNGTQTPFYYDFEKQARGRLDETIDIGVIRNERGHPGNPGEHYRRRYNRGLRPQSLRYFWYRAHRVQHE